MYFFFSTEAKKVKNQDSSPDNSSLTWPDIPFQPLQTLIIRIMLSFQALSNISNNLLI